MEGLGHQTSHKNLSLKFVLPAVSWDRSLAESLSETRETSSDGSRRRVPQSNIRQGVGSPTEKEEEEESEEPEG